MADIAVVVPTNRPKRIERWKQAWAFPNDVELIVVEDTEPTWKEIDSRFGGAGWIFARPGGAGARNYGFLLAAERGAQTIITLDDDCFPESPGHATTFPSEHINALNSPGENAAWQSTTIGGKPRGMPYFNTKRSRPTLINIGLWKGNADLDAPSQLFDIPPGGLYLESQTADVGKYIPMCGMNLAFKREALPMMYFGLQGPEWPYKRFDDIWCGIVAKKICDHLGYSIKFGPPFVLHKRVSNVWTNLRAEAAGLEFNEEFWQIVDSIMLTHKSIADCFVEIAWAFQKNGQHPYLVRLGEAMEIWKGLAENALSA